MLSDTAAGQSTSTPRRRALVLGGTGMLSGCVAALVGEGWTVVLPSRRYAPIPTERELTAPRPGEAALHALGSGGRLPTGDRVANIVHERPAPSPGKVLWVEADWSEPDVLAARAGKALGGPADLLVAWVHGGAREPVLHAIAPLLADDAPVVEVHSSSSASPLVGCPDPVLDEHATQQVVLGFVVSGDRTRWLNHREISDGVLTAVRRSLDGRPSAVHQVGEFRSWARRS